MPVPRKGESQKDYLKRCIPQVLDEGTAKDNKQAVAVCTSMYKQAKNKSRSILDEMNEELKKRKE
jgi:hypothetical protein